MMFWQDRRDPREVPAQGGGEGQRKARPDVLTPALISGADNPAAISCAPWQAEARGERAQAPAICRALNPPDHRSSALTPALAAFLDAVKLALGDRGRQIGPDEGEPKAWTLRRCGGQQVPHHQNRGCRAHFSFPKQPVKSGCRRPVGGTDAALPRDAPAGSEQSRGEGRVVDLRQSGGLGGSSSRPCSPRAIVGPLRAPSRASRYRDSLGAPSRTSARKTGLRHRPVFDPIRGNDPHG